MNNTNQDVARSEQRVHEVADEYIQFVEDLDNLDLKKFLLQCLTVLLIAGLTLYVYYQ